jgi:hypothetical protein
MKTFAAYFNYIGSIELPEDVVRNCSHSGLCDDDVDACLLLPEIKAELAEINPDQLRKELREHGAWNETELQDHAENLKRILWIAACNISDELVTAN